MSGSKVTKGKNGFIVQGAIDVITVLSSGTLFVSTPTVAPPPPPPPPPVGQAEPAVILLLLVEEA
jgi:hypothetical protein